MDYVEELAWRLFFLTVKLGYRHVICSQHPLQSRVQMIKIHVSMPFSQPVFSLLHSLADVSGECPLYYGSTFRKGCSNLATESCWGVVLKAMKRCHSDSSDLWS